LENPESARRDMIKKLLQHLAIIIQLGKIFFPSILLISLVYIFFTDFVQGKDIIITGLQSKQTGFFFLIALLFWVLITWYTSRLIAYNHDRLFRIAKKGLYHAPRLLGYACFSVFFIALISLEPENDRFYLHLVILIVNFILYLLLHKIIENINNAWSPKMLLNVRIGIWIIFVCSIGWMVQINSLNTYLGLLPVLQMGYLYLVITRRKISVANKNEKSTATNTLIEKINKQYNLLIIWIFTDPSRQKETLNKALTLQTERNIFLLLTVFSICALLIYFNFIFNISFARFISPLPIILISFAVLLGAGNMLSLFSIKLQINFHFLFILSLIVIGYFVETHHVSIQKPIGSGINYHERPMLREKFNHWFQSNNQSSNKRMGKEFPVYFVIADGGASRSAYWTASVLSMLEEKSNGKFAKHLFCLSGASGGSFGNMVFYGSMRQKDSKPLIKVQSYLSTDFLSFPLARLLGPDLVIPFIPGLTSVDRANALEKSMEVTTTDDSISAFMRKDLSAIMHSADASFNPVIAINTTRMQDGAPGYISNIQLKNDLSGRRIDVLEQLDEQESMKLSTAVVLGARFPYFSPAGRIKNQYFVDGGYFDNSGGGVVHEMILDLHAMIEDSYKQIRFHVIHISNQAEGKNKITKIHPLVNDLAAPIKTIMGSYERQTDFNNIRLSKYLSELYKDQQTFHAINLYRKGELDLFPMNWSISAQSLEKMNQRLYHHEELEILIKNMLNN
jgi:Patatin-like phospholipase